MDTHASVGTRVMAAIKGEVPAADLEAYRRAGGDVFALLEATQARRSEMLCSGSNAWTVGPGTQYQLLACWVAYACQSIGDDFLDADYRADRHTVGFVPPVTAKQAMTFYAEVGEWVSAAREAEANPSLATTLTHTVAGPGWIDVEPCPAPHLDAMVTVAGQLQTRAEALLADVLSAPLDAAQTTAVRRVQQLLSRGASFADRARALWGTGTNVSPGLHEEIETAAKESIRAAFDAGQLLSMPKLIAAYDTAAASSYSTPTTGTLAAPGTAAFDPWCLTDPKSRPTWKRDLAAQRAIDALWRNDPQPAKTLAIQAQIDAALARDDIELSPLGHYFCCPWAPVYRALNPVTLGGTRVRRGQTFTYDVSAEEVGEGGPFVRRVYVANFSPTDEVDYCNPDAD